MKYIVCSMFSLIVMEAIIMIMAVVAIRLSVVYYVVISDHICSIMDKITTLSNNLRLQI